MGEQYKQLQFRDRLKIEARLNIGYKPKQIAADLGVHVSTIYREVKRGTYTHMNSDLTTDIRYSPEIAEARYQESLSAKGAPLKIGKCDVTRSVSKMTEIERRGGKRWDKPKKAEKSRDCGGGKF